MTATLLYDPLDPATIADPFPVYDRLRTQAPMHWHEPTRSWIVSRYADCLEVLRDAETFARDMRRVGEDVPDHRLNIQSIDPPQHSLLRALFVNTVKQQPMTSLDNSAWITNTLAALPRDTTFDFMTEVAAPYAMHIVSELLGVESGELVEFSKLSEAITRRMDSAMRPDADSPGDDARRRLNAMVDGWLDNGEKSGLLADIGRHRNATQIPYNEIRNTAAVIYNAGYSTVFSILGNIGHLLMARPELLENLADSDRIDSGVEELLRLEGPVQGTSRAVTVPVELHGVRLVPGDMVLVLLAAANRDPRQFDRPDEVVLDRSPSRHLSFGWGPHYCLGNLLAHSAVKQFVCALGTSARRFSPGGTPTRRRTATIRSFETLPVTAA